MYVKDGNENISVFHNNRKRHLDMEYFFIYVTFASESLWKWGVEIVPVWQIYCAGHQGALPVLQYWTLILQTGL